MSDDIKRIDSDKAKELNPHQLLKVGMVNDGSFVSEVSFVSDVVAIAGGHSGSANATVNAWVSMTVTLAQALAKVTGEPSQAMLNIMQLTLAERLISEAMGKADEAEDDYDPFTPNHKMH